jgi:hypothetical protein
MGTETNLNLPDLSNLAIWTVNGLLNPPPPKIDVRMTTIETDDGIDVLMVISIDDEKIR